MDERDIDGNKNVYKHDKLFDIIGNNLSTNIG
jgi:hypothetical protein